MNKTHLNTVQTLLFFTLKLWPLAPLQSILLKTSSELIPSTLHNLKHIYQVPSQAIASFLWNKVLPLWARDHDRVCVATLFRFGFQESKP